MIVNKEKKVIPAYNGICAILVIKLILKGIKFDTLSGKIAIPIVIIINTKATARNLRFIKIWKPPLIRMDDGFSC